MQIDDLIKTVEDALAELKAKDVVRIDVRELTGVTDYMIIARGGSNRQVGALADNVIEKVKEAGLRPLGIEGKESGEWVLVDLGDIVVHIMQPATRQFYELEKLWQSSDSRREQQQPTAEYPALRIRLTSVASRMPRWVAQGYAEYAKRMPADLPVELVEIPLATRGKNADVARLMRREGEQMLAATQPGDRIVTLEVEGRPGSTEALAARLENWRLEGRTV